MRCKVWKFCYEQILYVTDEPAAEQTTTKTDILENENERSELDAKEEAENKRKKLILQEILHLFRNRDF